MPASRAGAAAPGWLRAALAALLLLPGLTGLAAAQQAQGQSQGQVPRAGAATRPNAGAAGPGLGPLQPEPGDIWSDVRGWTEKRGRAERPAEQARRRDPAAAEAAPRRAEPGAAAPAPPRRRAEACPAGTPPEDPACAPRPPRRRPAEKPG